MLKKRYIILTIFALILTSCVVYTEKRSEALSRTVYATADSIVNGRFEKAYEYSIDAKKLAYKPKVPIVIPPVITEQTKQITAVNGSTAPDTITKSNGINPTSVKSSIITSVQNNGNKEKVLRLVVPAFLKDAKLLVENSDEWNELMKIKEFSDQIKLDNENLKKNQLLVEEELAKQNKYNNEMVVKINQLEKSILSKNLHIIKLYIVIVLLLVAIGGGVYLRIKGIL